MPLELARVRLRGLYAIVAGAQLLLGIPLFEGFILVPAGYFSAIQTVSGGHSFGPLLLWLTQHATLDVTFHVVELIPFLLALQVFSALRLALWPQPPATAATPARQGGWRMTLLGQAGCALYVIAILVGTLEISNAATAFAAARSAAAQSAVAQSFASQYAVQSLISNVAGACLLALSLALFGLRCLRTGGLPRWLGAASVLPAGLLVATAIQYLPNLAQVETGASSLALATLALWLIVLGVALARLRALPAAATYASAATGGPDASDEATPHSGAASSPISHPQ